jgi:hypothetical protein
MIALTHVQHQLHLRWRQKPRSSLLPQQQQHEEGKEEGKEEKDEACREKDEAERLAAEKSEKEAQAILRSVSVGVSERPAGRGKVGMRVHPPHTQHFSSTEQVHRVLAPGGHYLVISYDPPSGRSWLLGSLVSDADKGPASSAGGEEGGRRGARVDGWEVIVEGYEHEETGNYIYILRKAQGLAV